MAGVREKFFDEIGKRGHERLLEGTSGVVLAEIHDGDPMVRADWPWHWWGLEPFNRRRQDWRARYASVFRVKKQT